MGRAPQPEEEQFWCQTSLECWRLLGSPVEEETSRKEMRVRWRCPSVVPICSHLSRDWLCPTVDGSLLRAQKLQVPQAGPGVSKGVAEEGHDSEEHGADEKPCCFPVIGAKPPFAVPSAHPQGQACHTTCEQGYNISSTHQKSVHALLR